MKTNSIPERILSSGIFILLGILLLNSFFVFSLGNDLNVKIDEAKELARPAKIEMIKLESSCTDCFNIDEVANALKTSNLEILNEKSLPRNSQEAIRIISKYSIKRLPTILLKGEIDKASIQNFIKADDVLIFDGVAPPYEDAASKKIIGKVSSIIINDAILYVSLRKTRKRRVR